MNIFQITIVITFLIISPLISLYLQNKNRAINCVYLISGIAMALIGTRFFPKGLNEVAIFVGFFGVFFSFYKILDSRNNDSLSDNTFTKLYLVLSGIYVYIGVAILLSLLSDQQFRVIGIVSLAVCLPIITFVSYKINDIPAGFKSFISSLAVLSIPGFYKLLADFIQFLIHETVHLNYTTFMFPDHPFLEPQYYQVMINTIFNNSVTDFAIFLFLMVPSILILLKIYWLKMDTKIFDDSVERRKALASQKRKWRLELIIVLVVGLLMFSSTLKRYTLDQGVTSNYFPIQASSGYITINTSKPLYQIQHGQIKKYQFIWKSKSINFIVFRWNDRLVSVMDFCEFCNGEDEGYYLKDNKLFCKICQTPINPELIGAQGGCNPVPLKSQVSKFTIKISLKDLIDTYIKKKGNG